MLQLTPRYISLKTVLRAFIYLIVAFTGLKFFGAFSHLFEKDFYTDFHYPYDGDIEPFVHLMKNNITPPVNPINAYDFRYIKNCSEKCKGVEPRLVYLVKSSPENFEQRISIRSTWGFERRFSDVTIRTIFLIGELTNNTHVLIDKEAQEFNDIVQGNFTDSYYNNTLKTMLGFGWAVHFCSSARYYMFVDDDYYVSTKNVLAFVRNPTNYPEYLTKLSMRHSPFEFDLDKNVLMYAGYAFKTSPHRHYSSKWQVSLEEYPYHMWPTYITAGAYILSKEALLNMYFTSFYTKHFRFDDIYVGLLAYKAKIEPFHHDEFYFHKKTYHSKAYQFTIASHGYKNHDELLKIWTEQRSLGNA